MFARRIAVVGTGYVGLTTDACLASLEHRVICADVDEKKIERLQAGEIGIGEDGLAELVSEGIAAGRLSFVVGAAAALDELEREGAPGEVMFLCVPTPMGVGGIADLAAVEAVIEEVRDALPAGTVVVNKSTVPVGTAVRTAELFERDDVAVVSNPEFLRGGSAVHDFLHPDLVVVDSSSQGAAKQAAALYACLGAPMVLTDAATSEMIKYAANCFLAMKLSYVNAIAELCECLDSDVVDVTEGIGDDKCIDQESSHLARDGAARACPRTTTRCCRWPIRRTSSSDCSAPPSTPTHASTSVWSTRSAPRSPGSAPGRSPESASRCGGLAFKAGTDDLRDSPALGVAALLKQAGTDLVAYDPGVTADEATIDRGLVTVVDDPYLAAKDAEAIVIRTEWPEFWTLDWPRVAEVVRRPIVIDTRNLLYPDVIRRAALTWTGVGRTMHNVAPTPVGI